MTEYPKGNIRTLSVVMTDRTMAYRVGKYHSAANGEISKILFDKPAFEETNDRLFHIIIKGDLGEWTWKTEVNMKVEIEYDAPTGKINNHN